MPLTGAQLDAIVSARTFDTLIGEREGPQFECKAQPYQISADAGKRELAKDVSALANADGGVIFIGLKTKQGATHYGDEVEDIRPFSQTLVNTTQYLDILRAWVYPEIVGVSVEWIPTTPDPSKGLVVVRVPNQAERAKPFLITKTLDGSKQVETVFGYAVRKNDQNLPFKVEDLQRYVRSGLHYDQQLEERLDAIAILLKAGPEHSRLEAAKEERREQLEQRIGRARQALPKDMRLLIVSAQPLEPSELQTIFLNTDKSVKRALERPPVLRSSGWDLSTLDQAKILRGELIRVTDGGRKVIDLYRDGTMVAAVSADMDFLAWGRERSLKINPIALPEFIHAATNFYGLVLSDFTKRPTQISFRIGLTNMHFNGAKSMLAPHGLNSFAQRSAKQAVRAQPTVRQQMLLG